MKKNLKINKVEIEFWIRYLNKVSGSFRCSVCGQKNWETQTVGNEVASTCITDAAIEAACREFLIEQGVKPSPTSPNESMADSVVIMRCATCGQLLFFDYAFVKEKIYG